jgi:F0F1-type ATP synthase membrane subunit b/b'
MNWTLFFDIAIIVIVALGFAGTVWYLMTHNPNYAAKEILKNPLKLFDLIDHAKQNVTEGLKKIKEQTQDAIDTTKQIKAEVEQAVKQVQDTIKETKEDIKKLGDKK